MGEITWKSVGSEASRGAYLAMDAGMDRTEAGINTLLSLGEKQRQGNIHRQETLVEDNDAMIAANIGKLKSMDEWNGW